MGNFRGFSDLTNGLAEGASAQQSGAMQGFQQMLGGLAQRKQQQATLQAQSDAARAKLAEDAQKAAAGDASKNLETTEKGAEKGLRLAPTMETPDQINRRVQGTWAQAEDVRRSGGENTPEQNSALDTQSIGGAIRAAQAGRDPSKSTITQARPTGASHWEKDPALNGGPSPWKKGAVYDIEDQARQNVNGRLGTEPLMQAIMGGALQGQPLVEAVAEYNKRHANFETEMAKETRAMVDFHEKNGDITPDEANRLRTHYGATWGGAAAPEQGAPTSAEKPAPAPPAGAVPQNETDAAANDAEAAKAEALAKQYEDKLNGAAMQGAEGEAESEGDTPAPAPSFTGISDRMKKPDALGGLVGDAAPTSGPSLLPDLRGQLQNPGVAQHGTSLGLGEPGAGRPMDVGDSITRALQKAQLPQPPGVAPPSMGAPPSPTPAMMPPPNNAANIAPIVEMLKRLQQRQSLTQQWGGAAPPLNADNFDTNPVGLGITPAQAQGTPFMPPARPRPQTNPAIPPAGAPMMGLPGVSASPSPSPGPAAGLMQRLGLGGLLGGGPPPADASVGPRAPTPPQYTTTASHFPTDAELQHFSTPTGDFAMMPDAANAYAQVLTDSSLSPQQRAMLQQISSATRSPEQQNALAAEREAGDYHRLAKNPDGSPVPAPFATHVPRFGHLAGKGLDLPASILGDPALVAKLNAAGFVNPYPNDPVHWEYRK